jgi:hypothetical protein
MANGARNVVIGERDVGAGKPGSGALSSSAFNTGYIVQRWARVSRLRPRVHSLFSTW